MNEAIADPASYRPPAIHPPEHPLSGLRLISTALNNMIETWPRAVYEEPFHKQNMLGKWMFVTDPDAIRRVLLDDAENFPRGSIFQKKMKPIWREMLFTAEGARWRWQRRASAPAFRPERVIGLTHFMTEAAEGALARWRQHGAEKHCNVIDELSLVSFNVVLNTILSGGEGFDVEETSRRVKILLRSTNPGLADFLRLPGWSRVLLAPRVLPAATYMRRFVGIMIASRRTQVIERGDLVDLLMNALDPETQSAMSDVELRDNLIGFIGAGHDTTTLAIAWALYLVGNHPPTEARVLAEIKAVAGEEPIGPTHVSRLVFTKQVIQEAMRLFPPIPALLRTCARKTELAGQTCEAGTLVWIPIYALHRHKLYWRDPNVFDPDRFAPAAGLDKQRFTYMPFGAGARICIGAAFTYVTTVTILATLLRKVHFEPDPAHPVRLVMGVSLRPRGGMPMKLRFRS
jgi:cytochrome P450